MKDDDVFNAIASENYTFLRVYIKKCLELLDQIEGDLYALDAASNFLLFHAKPQNE